VCVCVCVCVLLKLRLLQHNPDKLDPTVTPITFTTHHESHTITVNTDSTTGYPIRTSPCRPQHSHQKYSPNSDIISITSDPNFALPPPTLRLSPHPHCEQNVVVFVMPTFKFASSSCWCCLTFWHRNMTFKF
jgi:hypothetical protein